MLDELRYAGKAVIVTGAGQGIGRATAEVLGEMGATVYAVDREESGLAELARAMAAAGASCRPFRADVAREDEAFRLRERILADGAKLKALVNNVGTNLVTLAEDLSLAQWNEILTINLTSTFLMVRAMLPLLLAEPDARPAIVNVSSGYGLIGGPRMPVYSASKAGIIGFTRQLTVDYGAKGLRANVVCPGLTLSPRVKRYIETGWVDAEAQRGRVLSRRFAECREIANVIAFLASDAASYVTGAVVPVDGGQTAS